MKEQAEVHKHIWRDNAIQIYSAELHHWEEIRSYYQSRVDEADAKIKERFQLIADLEGKQPKLPFNEDYGRTDSPIDYVTRTPRPSEIARQVLARITETTQRITKL